jgi:Regulatory CLIP domain of proteinases
MIGISEKECTTPDLKPGTCVPLRDCQIILDLLEWLQKQIFGLFKSEDNLKSYLSRSQCGYDDKLKKVYK